MLPKCENVSAIETNILNCPGFPQKSVKSAKKKKHATPQPVATLNKQPKVHAKKRNLPAKNVRLSEKFKAEAEKYAKELALLERSASCW